MSLHEETGALCFGAIKMQSRMYSDSEKERELYKNVNHALSH